MVLYGYDASVYNSVQGSDHWVAWFNNPDANLIGAINTGSCSSFSITCSWSEWILRLPRPFFILLPEHFSNSSTAYTVGAIVGGWFIGGPIADFLGRKTGMGIGCFLTIIATFMQTFSPKGNLGCFIGGRVLIGIGQGIALSTRQFEHL